MPYVCTKHKAVMPCDCYAKRLMKADIKLDQLGRIFKWLLGEKGDFPIRPEGGPAYWWRSHLRKRLSALGKK